MSEKHKKVCRTLNHFEHIYIFVSAVKRRFNFGFCFTILCSYRCCKFCSRVKNLRYNCKDQKYKSITKQKRKKHDKIELLAKTKLNTIKAVSKA